MDYQIDPETINAISKRFGELTRGLGHNPGYAISMIASELGMNRTRVSKILASKRWRKQSEPYFKKYARHAKELCPECGSTISQGAQRCNSCGRETGL